MNQPLDQVIKILTSLRDSVDRSERTLIEDISYCLKVISSNQLYEAEIILKDTKNM